MNRNIVGIVGVYQIYMYFCMTLIHTRMHIAWKCITIKMYLYYTYIYEPGVFRALGEACIIVYLYLQA